MGMPSDTPPQSLPLEIGDDGFDAVHVHVTLRVGHSPLTQNIGKASADLSPSEYTV